jgi:hypothetical protein
MHKVTIKDKYWMKVIIKIDCLNIPLSFVTLAKKMLLMLRIITPVMYADLCIIIIIVKRIQ